MNDNQGNGSLLGKFRQRLRAIRISRGKRKRRQLANDLFIEDKLKRIKGCFCDDSVRVEIVRTPKGIGTSFKENKKFKLEKTIPSKNDVKKVIKVVPDELEKKKIEVKEVENKYSLKRTSKGISNDVEKNDKKIISNVKKVGSKKLEKEDTIHNLGSEIILKIKGQFEYHLDELEVLEGELYFLSCEEKEEVNLDKVKKVKKEINELIEKINIVIEEYNLYSKNYYIENITDISDRQLVDDIINYRSLLDSLDKEKAFVGEYKFLEEFQYLYQKLVSMKDNTSRLVIDNERKIEKFGIRDKKYQEMQSKMGSLNECNQECSLEIQRQNEYLAMMMNKIGKIDKSEYNTYHLKGVFDLLSQSVHYLGLMLVSPFRGMIPGIAIQTLATKRLMGNIYRNLHFEEVHYVQYHAINYEKELNDKLDNIDYVSCLIEDTLQDISYIKEDFLLQYDSRIQGYDDTLKKIDKIEEMILRNQNKVSIIKKKLKVYQDANHDKMIRVLKLNEKLH